MIRLLVNHHNVWDIESLKPTATPVTHFAKMAKPAPRYGSLVPQFYKRKSQYHRFVCFVYIVYFDYLCSKKTTYIERWNY